MLFSQPIPSADLSAVVSEWDLKFITVDLDMVYSLINAASYMQIDSLMELGCAKLASLMKVGVFLCSSFDMILMYVCYLRIASVSLYRARHHRRSAKSSTSRTTSLLRRRGKSERRTSGLRSRLRTLHGLL